MITLPINTTRDLTPAELAAAQAFLDTINPPPGTITVVNTISHDAAFSGGTVTLNTPGAAPQEQFWRALNLPAVPLCATGPNVTLDFSADLTISNTTLLLPKVASTGFMRTIPTPGHYGFAKMKRVRCWDG